MLYYCGFEVVHVYLYASNSKFGNGGIVCLFYANRRSDEFVKKRVSCDLSIASSCNNLAITIGDGHLSATGRDGESGLRALSCDVVGVKTTKRYAILKAG